MNINYINSSNFGKIAYPCCISKITQNRVAPYEKEIDKIANGKNVYINDIIDKMCCGDACGVPIGWTVSMLPQDKFSKIKNYTATIPDGNGLNLGEAVLEAVSKLSQIV